MKVGAGERGGGAHKKKKKRGAAHSDVDLSKPLEIHLIMLRAGPPAHVDSIRAAQLTSGRAFSGFRVHSCPELAAAPQTGPLRTLHQGPPPLMVSSHNFTLNISHLLTNTVATTPVAVPFLQLEKTKTGRDGNEASDGCFFKTMRHRCVLVNLRPCGQI